MTHDIFSFGRGKLTFHYYRMKHVLIQQCINKVLEKSKKSDMTKLKLDYEAQIIIECIGSLLLIKNTKRLDSDQLICMKQLYNVTFICSHISRYARLEFSDKVVNLLKET